MAVGAGRPCGPSDPAKVPSGASTSGAPPWGSSGAGRAAAARGLGQGSPSGRRRTYKRDGRTAARGDFPFLHRAPAFTHISRARCCLPTRRTCGHPRVPFTSKMHSFRRSLSSYIRPCPFPEVGRPEDLKSPGISS